MKWFVRVQSEYENGTSVGEILTLYIVDEITLTTPPDPLVGRPYSFQLVAGGGADGQYTYDFSSQPAARRLRRVGLRLQL